MAERQSKRSSSDEGLSRHILPTASMVGVCTTLIGLVKILEARIGPSRVDEYASLTAIPSLVSAVASYLSIRLAADNELAIHMERCADICFVLGLGSLSVIAILFAYKTI